MRNRHFVSSVDFHEDDDDDEKPRLCTSCLARGYKFKLGAKIIQKDKEPEPDHDQWLQCYECFNIYPVHESKYEQSLEGFAQTSDNPFDDQKGQVLSASPRRFTEAGRKVVDKRRRERQRMHHKDPEIDREIQQFGEENVHIIYDSDP